MKTLEMMNQAKLNGRTYKYSDMYYSEEKGFTDCNGDEWTKDSEFSTPNNLLKLDEWKIVSKLSENEISILKSILPRWVYIARDEDGNLFVYDGKPKKSKYQWDYDDCNFRDAILFNHLFNDVKWTDSKPTLVEDLLAQ